MMNSADPDQTLQNVASDQGLHYFLKLQKVKGKIYLLRPRCGKYRL